MTIKKLYQHLNIIKKTWIMLVKKSINSEQIWVELIYQAH